MVVPSNIRFKCRSPTSRLTTTRRTPGNAAPHNHYGRRPTPTTARRRWVGPAPRPIASSAYRWGGEPKATGGSVQIPVSRSTGSSPRYLRQLGVGRSSSTPGPGPAQPRTSSTGEGAGGCRYTRRPERFQCKAGADPNVRGRARKKTDHVFRPVQGPPFGQQRTSCRSWARTAGTRSAPGRNNSVRPGKGIDGAG